MQIISKEAAADLIGDRWTIATSGFTGIGHPENISRAVEARFLANGRPRGLTLIYGAGQGDRESRGTARYAHDGLIDRVIGGHWGAAGPRLANLVNQNRIAAYNLPQGVIAHLYRAIAGHKPGLLTTLGMHTFVDPLHGGGRLNARATETLVERVDIGGRAYLFYPAWPKHRIDCALIRATSSDARGNLGCEEEAVPQDVLGLAQAARNSGGIVIAQVKRLRDDGVLPPQMVQVPGILVDYVVVCDDPRDHWQTYLEAFNPRYCLGAQEADRWLSTYSPAPAEPVRPADDDIQRRLIQRIAAEALIELCQRFESESKQQAGSVTGLRRRPNGPVLNLGVGMPAGVGRVAVSLGHSNFTLTVESGPIGGIPAEARSFGASSLPESIVSHAEQFDFYDGGGLDAAFLGLAQFDPQGNVNVSKFGDKVAGIGGFINIIQTARRLVFMGSLTAKGLVIEARDGRLNIIREGEVKKLVPRVEHLSFSGAYARELETEVTYVTERAVFRLADHGIELTAIAPGIRLQQDVLDQLGAPVAVAPDLNVLPAQWFGG